MSSKVLPGIALSACLLAALPALAGRPLATDDAGTADFKTCQVEAWMERASPDRAWVVAPACGIAKGVELGADYSVPSPKNGVNAAGGLALKWVPESLTFQTGVGGLNFGAKLGASWIDITASGWRSALQSVLALATLEPNDRWTVHANLGLGREKFTNESATLLNLALARIFHQDFALRVECPGDCEVGG